MPPVFRHKIKNLEVSVGSPAKFECEIEAAPGVTFKWFKSGSELRHSDKCRIISRLHTSSLEIFSPTVADSGEFTCKASNRHGSDSCSAKLSVTGKKNIPFVLSICLLDFSLELTCFVFDTLLIKLFISFC